MKRQLVRSENRDAYCPSCTTSVSGAPNTCPECGADRAGDEWKPLEFCPHAYLGYVLDDRYLLDRYLGGGASGDVYRAIDRKLDRPFALKIIEFGPEGDRDEREEEVRRYRNEVQALSRLRNPHTIEIYESFELEHHTSGLLTEYIDGSTLGEIVDDQGPLSFERCLKIMRQVANGLHEAHEQGVVHRDLKPDNIMIEELPASGYFVRLLDFGLVRMVDDASHTDGFRGTPLYAAPEQCQPREEVDRRADIYSLGCVIFYAATGAPPFEGSNPIDLIESHTGAEPPSLRESSSDNPIPPRLDDLVDEMLRKDPEDRPADLSRVIEVSNEVPIPAPSQEQSSTEGHAETTEVEPLGEQSTIGDVESEEIGRSPEADESGTGSTRSGTLPAEFLQAADLDTLLSDYTPGATAVRLQKHGNCIALADGAHSVHLLARGAYEYEDSFTGAQMRLTSVAGPRRRGGVFASEMNGRILRWGVDLRSQSPESVAEVPARVLAMDVDADEVALAVGTEQGRVMRYDLRTGEVSHRFELSGPVCELRMASEGREGVAVTMSGDIERLAFDDGTEERTGASVGRDAGALAIDDRAEWVASVDRMGKVRVTSLREPDREMDLSPVPSELRSLNFSATGQLLAVTVAESNLRIWVFHHESVRAPGGPGA